MDVSSDALFRIYDYFYQIDESHFSRVFHNAGIWNCFKESFQWVSSVLSITIDCNRFPSRSIWSMVNVWPQWWKVVWVNGTRYGPWWPWYGQFDEVWLQTPRLLLKVWLSWMASVFVSWERSPPYAATSHLIWINCWKRELTIGFKSV